MVMPIKNEVFLYLVTYVHLADIQVKFQGRILRQMIAFVFSSICIHLSFHYVIRYKKNMHKENSFIVSGCFVLYIFFALERDG